MKTVRRERIGEEVGILEKVRLQEAVPHSGKTVFFRWKPPTRLMVWCKLMLDVECADLILARWWGDRGSPVSNPLNSG